MDSKYDTAFTINAMSDDDDDPELIAGEAKGTFRSVQAIEVIKLVIAKSVLT